MTDRQLYFLCEVIIACTKSIILSHCDESSIWGNNAFDEIPLNPFDPLS